MSEPPMKIFEDPLYKPSLDERFYSLTDDEYVFFKAQTGIEDEAALKQHIISVQKKAYELYGYPCIRSFSFTRLKISRMPAYDSVLKISRELKDAIILDIGCCFGNDLRKAVADGWPAQNAIASDLRQGFWELGHELFKSNSETFPAAFVAGDAFDPAFITPRAPFYDKPESPCPPLATLTSLVPLQGHISAIHASSLFHLFDEKQQLELARRLASLLSPIPGSTIFGTQGGSPEKQWIYEEAENHEKTPYKMFCHSPESWAELWDGQVFEKGSIRVDAGVKKVQRPDLGYKEIFMLWWTITRK
ncbi:hypothetical protein BDZ94DRAFT_1306096 [Collybia nuda]|uniref:Methyltransferase ausD n=1 Tax=Collybia nuda TaxID=64659 RepID=A0A9P5YAQ6_9AGAR|nr:hypothetical protein BDZ94DRAFT_1306096 [Collybia nuda]